MYAVLTLAIYMIYLMECATVIAIKYICVEIYSHVT